MRYACLFIETTAAPGRDAELRRHGLRAWSLPCALQGLDLLRHWHFDALVLGHRGPREPAQAPLLQLMQRAAAPVVLLAEQATDITFIRALELGLADCLAASVSSLVLAARLRHLIERARACGQAAPSGNIHVGSLRLDSHDGSAFVGPRPLRLTPQQFELLALLARRPGRVVPRAAVAAACAGAAGTGRGVDMLVCRIRQRLRASGASDVQLLTAYGRGWRLSAVHHSALAAQAVQRRWAAH